MAESWASKIANIFARALGKALRQEIDKRTRPSKSRRTSTRSSGATTRQRSSGRTPSLSDRYPGDFTGTFTITYDPHPGSMPDPGEVVWAWVPFEEDFNQGKDRPVLLLGRDADWLLGVPLTSKDHDRDAAQENRAGRYWVEVGTGSWDTQRRVSEARVDRVIRVNPTTVRRVGDKLDKARFDRVAAGVRRHR